MNLNHIELRVCQIVSRIYHKEPDGSYSILDIQNYIKHIPKKHETLTDNLPIRIFANKIENRITFKIKTGYYLQLLTSEKIKLLGNVKSKKTKNKNGANVVHLEINKVVLVDCNIVNKDYQQDSKILYFDTFVPNKYFGHLFDISQKNLMFLENS